MLAASSKFPNYMFRSYALRRVRDAFREHQSESDPVTIQKLVQEAERNLLIIQRQVIVGSLYRGNPFAIERVSVNSSSGDGSGNS